MRATVLLLTLAFACEGDPPADTGSAGRRSGTAWKHGSFEQVVPFAAESSRYTLDGDGDVVQVVASEGVDLVGVLPGRDPLRSSEYVALVAHYDHLGVTFGGDVCNGAFDDITAAATLVEIARVLHQTDVVLTIAIDWLMQLAAWAADDPARYSDGGPQELSVEGAEDGVAMLEGVLGSSVLEGTERNTVEDMRDKLADIASRGDAEALEELESGYVSLAFYLMFTLTQSHPGDVPPPLPE